MITGIRTKIVNNVATDGIELDVSFLAEISSVMLSEYTIEEIYGKIANELKEKLLEEYKKLS